MTPEELQDRIARSEKEIDRLSREAPVVSAAALVAIEQSKITVAACQLTEISSRRLERQTEKLIKFTTGLYVLTGALVFFAFVQIIIMLLDYCSKNHQSSKSTDEESNVCHNQAA